MHKHQHLDQNGRGFRGFGGFRDCGPGGSADPRHQQNEERGFGFGRCGFGHSGFGRGRHHDERGRMRGFGGPWGQDARGFGGGRERLFEGGDLRLVILNLLAEQPSYGYQIMKRLEQKLAGGYTPSAGVIYPTLTMLEEEGLTSGEVADGKKVFTVTDAGKAYLQQNTVRLQAIQERLDHTGGAFERGRSPEIMRAFMNLRLAVKARTVRNTLSPEQVSRIAEAIEKAAAAIDAL